MTALLEILALISRLITQWRKQHENEQHQAEAEEIQNDPAEWFTDHFGGVSKQPDDGDADKADTDTDATS